ncbi:hypothetical protein ACW95P_01375 [Candidatus Mycoplasma pogonae]
MTREIYVVIRFANSHLAITALENIHGKFNNIFYSSQNCLNLASMKKFVKATIGQIEHKIRGKIHNVYVQIHDNKNLGLKIDLNRHILQLTEQAITKQNLKLVVNELVNQNANGYQNISIQPYQYLVQTLENTTKAFFSIPIEQKVAKVEMLNTEVKIDINNYNFFKNFFNSLNLNLISILPTSFANAYALMNEMVLEKGLFNLNIGNEQSTLVRIQNHVILEYITYDFGTNNLVKKIANDFQLDSKIVNKILKAYKDVFLKTELEFDFNKKIISSSTITYGDIASLVQKFIKQIFTWANQLLINKQNLQLPLFITGKINNYIDLEDYAQKFFGSKAIYVSQKKYFQQFNQSQAELQALGVVKYFKQLDDIFEQQKYHTLIDTQPIKISNLLPNKQSLIQALFKKLIY